MKDIYYEIKGNGFPILLLHGNMENHHIFDKVVDVLSKDYQCIAIDTRHHGKSTKSGKVSYETYKQDMLSLCDELNISEYDVIGFSDGAIIGLLLAMCDKRCKHLVSIGANTNPKGIKNVYRYQDMLRRLLLIPFTLYNPKAKRQYQLLKLMATEPNISESMLESIQIPVLILAGERDMIEESDTRKISEHIPYNVLKIIENGSHFLLEDSFKETMKEITLFLKICHE